jgi:VanZ family protein
MSFKYFSELIDLFLIVFVFVLAFLSITKSTGFPSLANYVELVFGSDKALHFFAGTVITLSVFRGLCFILEASYKYILFLTGIISVLILSFDEFSQLFNVYRQFSPYDLYAGFLGLFLALIILLFVNCDNYRKIYLDTPCILK